MYILHMYITYVYIHIYVYFKKCPLIKVMRESYRITFLQIYVHKNVIYCCTTLQFSVNMFFMEALYDV